MTVQKVIVDGRVRYEGLLDGWLINEYGYSDPDFGEKWCRHRFRWRAARHVRRRVRRAL